MKSKVTLLYFLAISLSMALLLSSCSDDNDNDPNPPSLTAPQSANIVIGGSTDLTFGVSADEGYQSASVSATSGAATISSEPESGATSGNVVVSYTGNASGAGSVNLTITDGAGQTANATAVISVGEEQTTVRVTDNISSNTTWQDGVTYILGGRISVLAGATLTIEGGAVVKGEAGEGANATALVIARDATLNANGSPDAPIIFTSIADNITPEMVDAGQFGSPNLSPTQRGLWGGLIVLGNAPISASNEQGDVTEVQIEGIPTSDTNGLYGGNDPDDGSGSITYISIRHGGSLIGSGNEINGLTLGGVGRSTTIQNVEVVANLDDGVEFFGGTVNVTNLLVWNEGDDAIDTDQAWSGTIDNVVVIGPDDGGSVMELDGPEGSFTSSGHTITNVSASVGANAGFLIDTDGNTDANVSNVVFFGLVANSDGSAVTPFDDNYSEYAGNSNGYAITSIQAVIPSGSTASDFFPSGLLSEVTTVADISSATVGADATVFTFTWASTSGTISSIGL